MGSNMYNPVDNYERNFLMVKSFGSKSFMLLIPIFMMLRIVCIGYLSITKQEMMEVTLLRLLFSKISPDISFQKIESTIMIVACVFSLYFIVVFALFYLASIDPSKESVPKTSLSMAYKWSIAQVLVLVLMFISTLFFIALFAVKGPEYFEEFANVFNITVKQMEAYQTTILLTACFVAIILATMIWFSQSQASFVKSINMTLSHSVAKNKGAHTYGVFSMAVALALLIIACIMTFLYYCYKDALTGFGVNMEMSYVCVSLLHAYLRGMVPFLIAISAFTYSETVEAANTVGTLYYNHVETIGTVQDPNLNRKKG